MLSIGTIVNFTTCTEAFSWGARIGAQTCEVVSWAPSEITEADAKKACAAANSAGVKITSFWCGWSGPAVWDFVDGPNTIGLVPPEYRKARVKDLKKGADIASRLGAPDLVSHVGFLPMNPQDPNYIGAVEALKEVASYAAEQGLHFNFETGQETPAVLLRTIQDVNMNNLGINLDPANLLMYGNGNPVDALDVFGHLVRGVHAKDGEYPTNGYELGEEKPLGEGRVNFPALVAKLKAIGYRGPLTIEREITGPQQAEDIKKAVEILKRLV